MSLDYVKSTVDIKITITNVGLCDIVRVHRSTRRARTRERLWRKLAIVLGCSRNKDFDVADVGLILAIMGLEMVSCFLHSTEDRYRADSILEYILLLSRREMLVGVDLDFVLTNLILPVLDKAFRRATQWVCRT
jgi:hypothetical protein